MPKNPTVRKSGRTPRQPAAASGTKSVNKKATKSGTKTGGKHVVPEQGDTVDWDKDGSKLSLSLMAAITDDKEIETALFPKVGPNQSTQNGGGKPKTDHYWELCKALFTDHPEHGATFALALKGGKRERGPWTTKIKNRLRRMVEIVNKGRETLGKTGEGIEHEADITEETPLEFRNKWAQRNSNRGASISLPCAT
ncbi:hypothetical protein BD311DRAFT_362035 [Dichomitus squalens]|uniref:Uncharacterized protein n=1 Tax=Dichomitus squalens TaxID=114155 RepID=A0A4Q9MJZ6_9APHY|nr:hypothetical protein BD311DRAFT_362035 [Dichomitus squalens]